MNNENYVELLLTKNGKSIRLTPDALSLLEKLIYDQESFSRALCQMYEEEFGAPPSEQIYKVVREQVRKLSECE